MQFERKPDKVIEHLQFLEISRFADPHLAMLNQNVDARIAVVLNQLADLPNGRLRSSGCWTTFNLIGKDAKVISRLVGFDIDTL